MGMDFTYAGSASYPRFDEEIKGLVKLFGGKESFELEDHKEDIRGTVKYAFGYSSGSDIRDKYLFPLGTNSTLVKWFNNLYSSDFTVRETEEIYTEMLEHKQEADSISPQVMYELDCCAEYGDAWHIS